MINWDALKPNSKVFPVGDKYWAYIWLHMQKDGLVEGVAEIPIMGEQPVVKLTPMLMITPAGIRFLEENSTMAGVRDSVLTVAELVTTIF